MAIEFTKKYEPLFHLLHAWEKIEHFSNIGLNDDEQSELKLLIEHDKINDPPTCEQQINDLQFKGLSENQSKNLNYYLSLSKVDTVLIGGGRESGKTFGLSSMNVVAARDFNHRILFTRQVMSTTDSSIKSALVNRMNELGVSNDFDFANNEFAVKAPDAKGLITITGQQTASLGQTAKLKSLENYSIFETDEGEELKSYEEWVKIKRSMRAKDVQCLAIIAFNPPSRLHWMYDKFYKGVPDDFNGVIDNVMYIHTTYLDNGKKNVAPQNWAEFEKLRLNYEIYEATSKDYIDKLDKQIVKDWAIYKYDILGFFKPKQEGVIYPDWRFGEFDASLPYRYGQDFGSSDQDATVKVAVDHGRKLIYLHEILFQNGLSTGALCQILMERVGRYDVIVGDSNSKRTIEDLQEYGLNSIKCRKYPGSVLADIKLLQGYTIIITKESVNLREALDNYCWMDGKKDVPNHKFSHLPDAFRYGAISLIKD